MSPSVPRAAVVANDFAVRDLTWRSGTGNGRPVQAPQPQYSGEYEDARPTKKGPTCGFRERL